jgi:ribonuclease BN (tRNA processing enzyme)
MDTWTLTVLGASSTVAPTGDSNACLHLGNGERSVLIDAGGNLPQLMNEVDLDYRSITDVVITHSHPDHSYGFPFLSHAFYHSHHPVTCWSTPEAVPKLRKSLEAFDLVEPDRYLDVTFETVCTDEPEELSLVEGESLSATAFPTRHSRPGFGLRFQTDIQHLVYSGDTAPLDYLRELTPEIDHLLHDCQATEGYERYFEGGHSSAADIGRLADHLNVGVLVPFHHNLMEFPPDRHEIVDEIREYYRGSVLFPSRGLSFHL